MLWLNGQPVDGDSATFDLRDRGLLLGDGVFDTSLALNGAPVFAGRHVARLAHSCAELGIAVTAEYIAADLTKGAAAIGTGTMRLTVTRGGAPRGLLPPEDATPNTLLSATAHAPAKAWEPVRAITAQTRRNETSFTARHKCLGYLDAIRELTIANNAGAEEAVFLNTAGHVACCATGNVFALFGNVLKTPPLADGVLNGVIRDELLTIAPETGLTCDETHLTTEALHAADAVFMTNSLRLIAPLLALDAQPLAQTGLPRVSQLARHLLRHIERDHGPSALTDAQLVLWPC